MIHPTSTTRRREILARLRGYVESAEGEGQLQSEGSAGEQVTSGAEACAQDRCDGRANYSAQGSADAVKRSQRADKSPRGDLPAALPTRAPSSPALDRLHRAIGARERSYAVWKSACDRYAPVEELNRLSDDYVEAIDVYCEALLAHERAVAERAVRAAVTRMQVQ